MHEHTCIECQAVLACDGDVDLNDENVPVCDSWPTDHLCGLCAPDCLGPRERDRDEDDGQTYADPRDEMAERLERD